MVEKSEVQVEIIVETDGVNEMDQRAPVERNEN